MLDAKKCFEIYEYCQRQYDKLEKKEGRYSPKHDKTVLDMASKEFKMSENDINRAFDLVSQTNADKNMTHEKKERFIRKKLSMQFN